MVEDLSTAQNLLNSGNYKEALSIYDRCYPIFLEKFMEVKREYAICLQERLRYFESIKLTEELLNNNPNDTEMLLNYCICLGKQNKFLEAIEFYKKILSIDKNFKKQQGYYAYLLERTNQIEDAKMVYKLAVDNEPNNVWYLSHYAFFLQKIKEYEQADKYFREALDRDGKNTWLLKRYSYFLIEAKGKEEGTKYYENILKEEKENYNHYINMAEIYLISKDFNKIKKLLEEAETIEKPIVMQIVLLFYWGVYHISQEEYEEYNKKMEKMVDLKKKYKSYIHRDFIDLNTFVECNLNDKQKKSYADILEKLNN